MTQTPRQVWRDAIRDSDDPTLDRETIAVAFALDRDMSANGRTRASVRRLAKIARCHTDTVTDRLERLEEAGWLRRDWAGRGHRARYQASLPGLEVSDPAGQSSDGEVSDPAGQSADGECPTGAAEVSDGAAQSVRPGRTVPGNHVPGNHVPASSSALAHVSRGVARNPAGAEEEERRASSSSKHPSVDASVLWLKGGRPHDPGCSCADCFARHPEP